MKATTTLALALSLTCCEMVGTNDLKPNLRKPTPRAQAIQTGGIFIGAAELESALRTFGAVSLAEFEYDAARLRADLISQAIAAADRDRRQAAPIPTDKGGFRPSPNPAPSDALFLPPTHDEQY